LFSGRAKGKFLFKVHPLQQKNQTRLEWAGQSELGYEDSHPTSTPLPPVPRISHAKYFLSFFLPSYKTNQK